MTDLYPIRKCRCIICTCTGGLYILKTLILNGSPRKGGNTAFLLSRLREYVNHETIEIQAYYDGIAPCVDCRACQKEKGCIVNDKMQLIYGDEFNNIVIASPLYMSNLTPPLMGLASRLQAYYCAKRFLKDEFNLKEKKAALILVGGGDGVPKEAIHLSRRIFKTLHAIGYENYTVLSLSTDDIPSCRDENAINGVERIACHFNGNGGG